MANISIQQTVVYTIQFPPRGTLLDSILGVSINDETISVGERLAAAHLLRSWVRIPPGAWIFVCCECRVLSRNIKNRCSRCKQVKG